MIENLVATWGPLAVFAGCFAEGEAAALTGGMIAHRGLAGWGMITLAAAAGAFLSDQLWFFGARYAGATALMRCVRRRLPAVGQSGLWLAVIFRFVPGLRIAGPVVLAQSGLPPVTFVALDAAAALIWAAIWTGTGYHSGRAAEALFGRLHNHHWLLLLGVLIVLAALGKRMVIRRHKG